MKIEGQESEHKLSHPKLIMKIIYWLFVGLVSIGYIGVSGGFFIFYLISNSPVELQITFGVIFFSLIVIAAGIFFPLFYLQKRKKKHQWEKKIDELGLDEIEPSPKKPSQALQDFKEGLTKAIRLSDKDIDLTNLDWRKTKALLFQGEFTDRVCAICKLPFQEEDYILACPNCESLYHGEHLIEWLVSNGKCPVCGEQLL